MAWAGESQRPFSSPRAWYHHTLPEFLFFSFEFELCIHVSYSAPSTCVLPRVEEVPS